VLTLRPIRESDAPLLQDLHRRHSSNTRRLRFFSAMPELSPGLADRFSRVDFRNRAAFVAGIDGEEAIRAVARYDAVNESLAEVAFVVEDSLQGQGLGCALFELLAVHARTAGFRAFTAIMLAENTAMLHVFEKCASIVAVRRTSETVEVDMSLDDLSLAVTA
jgi:RimJ/RimL family protein N-acetyltransferase